MRVDIDAAQQRGVLRRGVGSVALWSSHPGVRAGLGGRSIPEYDWERDLLAEGSTVPACGVEGG